MKGSTISAPTSTTLSDEGCAAASQIVSRSITT